MYIEVSLDRQQLAVYDQVGKAIMQTAVSTAHNGAGEVENSFCTPRGWHKVRAKIGAGVPENTVFRGRRPTGEIYTPALREAEPERDWILTRILWLSGLEPGFNRHGSVDTMRRYIYIHGCPDEDIMGVASSHGCIKMHNTDVIELFDQIELGTLINIKESADS